MKINKEGKLEIDLSDIVDSLPEKDRRDFIKSAACSRQVIDWVIDYICGDDEDGWWTGDDGDLREKILTRVENTHLKDVTVFDWSLIKDAQKRLKEIESQRHIYWLLYHHPDRQITIGEFIGNKDMSEEHEFSTKRADEKVQEVIDIVKNAIKTK